MKTEQKNQLHRALWRIRQVEKTIVERYAEQEMRCPVHLSIGQEAVAVGICAHLKESDYAVSGHRAHAHYLAKGGDLQKMMAEIYGKVTGCCKGRGGSMHLVDLSVGFLGSTPIVGGSIPIGVGAAFGAKLKREERVTAIFLGEGATEEGVFAESLNFAALKKLPILFVCENNLYSVYSPLCVRQPPSRHLSSLAKAHGIIAFEGDGNRVDEVSEIAQKAVNYIREGNGPVFVELSTYRFHEHCGPNIDPFQPKEEVAHWSDRDPLRGIEIASSVQEEIDAEIKAAFEFARSSPFPHPDQEMYE